MAKSLAILCLMLETTDVWATDKQCDIDEHGLSLLQSKLEVVKSIEAPPWKGSIVMNAMQEIENESRAQLVAGAKEGAMPNMSVPGSVFSAVMVSMPISSPIIPRERQVISRQTKLEDKMIIRAALKSPCVVYGLGIAPASSKEYPTFENEMAERGCDTHGFDCSVKVDDTNVVNASFRFHPWCIGKDTQDNNDALDQTTYVKNKHEHLKFKSLADTMTELNHTRLDLLKFDIEGFEWSLFNDELFSGMVSLPRQMSFELHTEGAQSMYVSPEVVKGKGFKQVNELFLNLFDRGYRVVSKEINNGDRHCAEFVVVNEQ
jgi:hypothetical protein